MLEEDECVGGPYDGERRRQPAGLLSFGVFRYVKAPIAVWSCRPGDPQPVPEVRHLGTYRQDRTGSVNVWRWHPA